jgi:hypothetical protein
VASLVLVDLPGISVLRLMRTLRVLRLFSKLRSLRMLINALAASLVPVGNALVILVLILVIYAILGVQVPPSAPLRQPVAARGPLLRSV